MKQEQDEQLDDVIASLLDLDEDESMDSSGAADSSASSAKASSASEQESSEANFIREDFSL
ncbi:MAG: hypothetical protein VW868_04195, partial [Bacteroidota bacterium]